MFSVNIALLVPSKALLYLAKYWTYKIISGPGNCFLVFVANLDYWLLSTLLLSVLIKAWVHFDMQTCSLSVSPVFKNWSSLFLWRLPISLLFSAVFHELHCHIFYFYHLDFFSYFQGSIWQTLTCKYSFLIRG